LLLLTETAFFIFFLFSIQTLSIFFIFLAFKLESYFNDKHQTY